jgi:predicted protein tyrosine phosphatase
MHGTEGMVDSMNDDLISRQQAIDVIDKIFPADPMRNDYTQGITCGAALATEYIKQLPSAQPLVIHCTDCEDWLERQSILGFTISELPSAQPEIIHCRDCKWHNGEINQCNAQVCASMCGDDFCSRAEKREE